MLEVKKYTYKEVCEAMSWKVKSGNSKLSQLKELNRYCNYTKEGKWIYVKQVFNSDEIKEKEEIKTKFCNYIEKLIMYELSQRPLSKDGYTIKVAKNTLYKSLNMINQNYNKCRNNINSFSRCIEVPTVAVYDFYNNTSGKLKDNVERALNKLQNKALIKWNYETSIKKKDSGYIRRATDEEINIILEAERGALTELKQVDKAAVFKLGKWNEFQSIVTKNLEDTNIFYYFDIFIINTTRDFRSILSNINIEEYRRELNTTMYLSAVNTAEKKHDKTKDKYKTNTLKEGELYKTPFYENEKVRLRADYIDFTKKIANNVIENDRSNIELNEFSGDQIYTLDEYLINNFEYLKEFGNLNIDDF